MGIIDYGNQVLSFDFQEIGKAKNFNKLNYKITQPGIYEGGLLTYIDSSTIQFDRCIMYLEDNVNKLGIRLETEDLLNITVDMSTPYIVARFEWINSVNNYADIIAVDYASIDPKDIIIGRCAYDSGNNLQATFDYCRRTISSLQDLDDKHTNLKVLPTEPVTNTVSALAGDVLILNNPYSFAGATSDTISDTVDGRIDIVYIDDSGDLKILEGSDNASPVQPDFPSRGLAIAKITRTGGVHTVVRGDQIEQLEYDGISGGASSGGGGGSSIEATCGESIDAGEVVYFGSNGKLYLADNRELAKSIVAGIALETGGVDGTITVGKLGLVQEYSGLTIGAEYYLGHDGLLTTLGSLEITEYKVHIGTSTADDIVDLFVQLPEPTRNQDDGNPVNSVKYFGTYKDRSAYGYFPFALDNAISQANYPVMFEEVGHTFNEQHVAAGDADLSASGTLFYPTPIPGGYDRAGSPDSAIINSTDDVDDSAELITLVTADYDALHQTRGVLGTGADGVPVRVKLVSGALPTGLAINTTYFVRFGTSPNISLHTTEANAISNISAISMTDAVGTFRLTQEGIVLDDAFQKFNLSVSGTSYGMKYGTYGASSGGAWSADTGKSYVSADTPRTSGPNGTPRPTNETRGRTTVLFAYMKVEHVTTSGEPVSALRDSQPWVEFTGDWTNKEFIVTPSSAMGYSSVDDIYDLQVEVWLADDDTPTNPILMKNISRVATTTGIYGIGVIPNDSSSFKLQTGSDGIHYLSETGSVVLLGPAHTGAYKVVITKPNLVATYADTSFRKVYSISDTTNHTFTLPDASTQLTEYNIKRTGIGAGTVTVTTSGSDTIEGSASDYIMRGDETLRLIPNGTNWAIVSTNEKRVCKAWVNFNGIGTVAIRDSENVDSITDNGTGSYIVNFDTAMDDTNFSYVCSTGQQNIDAAGNGVAAITTTTLPIDIFISASGVLIDSSDVNVQVFGS